ncbi:GNAT family N-acetyltransferase [Aurantiacibacter luteus]|uniref:GNAT family N-acetyltransferase n=1 Tax=Aurantiacibacter luteus TaxID=1581420 RepID=UPI001F4D0739|nr:GNAT family N-acetyltransferase [Aurantiacibacter luteus]
MSAPQPRARVRDWHRLDRPDMVASWDALARWASEPNPFYESWYLLASLHALDPRGKVRLFTLEVDGQLAGLLPLRRATSYYGHPLPHWRGWAHANCFLGAPLVARGFERLFWHELLAWADRHAGLAPFLHLACVPARGPLHDALVDELAATGRAAATVRLEERAMLSGNLDAESYLEASLSTKKRKELRRQHRRLAEEGELTSEHRQDSDGLGEWIADFLALEKSGWKGRQGSALGCDPATAALFEQALHGAARQGRLDRLALRLDGRPIAMLASFVALPGAFSFKTAYDESLSRFSPGVLMQLEALTRRDPREVRWIDSCAAQDHPMIDHLWRERRPVASLSLGIGGPLHRAAFAAIARRETGRPPTGLSA